MIISLRINLIRSFEVSSKFTAFFRSLSKVNINLPLARYVGKAKLVTKPIKFANNGQSIGMKFFLKMCMLKGTQWILLRHNNSCV